MLYEVKKRKKEIVVYQRKLEANTYLRLVKFILNYLIISFLISMQLPTGTSLVLVSYWTILCLKKTNAYKRTRVSN